MQTNEMVEKSGASKLNHGRLKSASLLVARFPAKTLQRGWVNFADVLRVMHIRQGLWLISASLVLLFCWVICGITITSTSQKGRHAEALWAFESQGGEVDVEKFQSVQDVQTLIQTLAVQVDSLPAGIIANQYQILTMTIAQSRKTSASCSEQNQPFFTQSSFNCSGLETDTVNFGSSNQFKPIGDVTSVPTFDKSVLLFSQAMPQNDTKTQNVQWNVAQLSDSSYFDAHTTGVQLMTYLYHPSSKVIIQKWTMFWINPEEYNKQVIVRHAVGPLCYVHGVEEPGLMGGVILTALVGVAAAALHAIEIKALIRITEVEDGRRTYCQELSGAYSVALNIFTLMSVVGIWICNYYVLSFAFQPPNAWWFTMISSPASFAAGQRTAFLDAPSMAPSSSFTTCNFQIANCEPPFTVAFFALIIRCTLSLEKHNGLGIFTTVLRRGSVWLVNFFAAFAIFVYIFAMVGHILIGYHGVQGFTTVGSSVISTLTVSLGLFDFDQLNSRNNVLPLLYHLYFWATVFFMFLIAPNILLAIVGDAFEEIHDGDVSNKHVLSDMRQSLRHAVVSSHKQNASEHAQFRNWHDFVHRLAVYIVHPDTKLQTHFKGSDISGEALSKEMMNPLQVSATISQFLKSKHPNNSNINNTGCNAGLDVGAEDISDDSVVALENNMNTVLREMTSEKLDDDAEKLAQGVISLFGTAHSDRHIQVAEGRSYVYKTVIESEQRLKAALQKAKNE